MAQLLDFQLAQQGELITWDQERQDKAILVLEGELEQLAPSFERGQWNWDDGDDYADTGEYVMRGEMTQDEYDYLCEPYNQIYSDCLREAGQDNSARTQCSRDYDENIKDIPKPGDSITTNKWELTTEVEFSNYDARGEIRTFADVKVGQILDMVCEHGGYMVGEITAITAGLWYENVRLEYNVLSAKGEAKGLTKLKIFTIDNTVDSGEFDNFLRKSGDTMEGLFKVDVRPKDKPTNSFIINQYVADADGNLESKVLLKDYKPQDTATYKSSIFYYGLCDKDEAIVNRGYANEHYIQKTGGTISGDLVVHKRLWVKTEDSATNGWNDGNVFVVNQQDATQGSIVRIKQNGTDKLKITYDGNTSLEDNKLEKVADPEAATDGANKQYVDNAVAAVNGGTGGLLTTSLWTLDEGMDRDETTKGKFCYDGSNFYMATSTASGNTWGPGAAGGRNTTAWVTIYSTEGKLMHTFEVTKISFKEKYGKKYVTEFDWAWEYSTSTLVDGNQYIIVVPGFLT